MALRSRRGTRALAALGALLLVSACAPQARRGGLPAPAGPGEEVARARELLRAQRLELAGEESRASSRIRRMVQLGMWDEAEGLLQTTPPTVEARTVEAELRLRQHRYGHAADLVAAVLRVSPNDREARLLQARLDVQAWELGRAAGAAEQLLAERPRDEDAALLLGRIRLLEKRYDAAAEWAARVQAWHPRSAGAHLLQSEVRFWTEDAAGAESALQNALQLDPLLADARFGYGYALWRRGDATLLGAMADQWNLALELDPLHFSTHWHLGNGHTRLTYADYARPDDEVVRERLSAAEALIPEGRVLDAIDLVRAVERDHPDSPLPAMLRGSAFYMAWDADRSMRLDSAEAAFRGVLARLPNYGPAHNGLAAVIKQRQFEVLSRFDSLQAAIAATPLPHDPAFAELFPDLRYYPGDRVARMVAQQLGPTLAYLAPLRRQGATFRIPPLHRDLAETTGNAFFRTATTFDNRQWMDIRGVGGADGAAGIEYVERGSHQERNVLLHEFVHMFHQLVLTEAEGRRVRELYHAALREDRTLDYYAASNEGEFFAQAFEAYLSEAKVHPLNHKSMNTRADLFRRDPVTYAFIDSLIARQQAALGGDAAALAGNWAQVFVNRAERERSNAALPREERLARAEALVDTALIRAPDYLPALLSRAATLRDQGRFAEAQQTLARVEALNPGYAAVYAARAELVGVEHGASADVAAWRASLLRQALERERDPAHAATLHTELRELFRLHARLPEAIAAAEEYVRIAPTASTYLRDRRDEAAAAAHALRVAAGYSLASLPHLADMVKRKPQNLALHEVYVDALAAAGRHGEAEAAVEEVLRVWTAGGRQSPELRIRLAESRLQQADSAGARAALEPLLRDRAWKGPLSLRLVRLLISLGESTEAHRRLAAHEEPGSPWDQAEVAFTRGWISEWRGDLELAERFFREALAANPYHRGARVRLHRMLFTNGRGAEARELARTARELPLPLGPDFWREIGAGEGSSGVAGGGVAQGARRSATGLGIPAMAPFHRE